MVVLICEKVPDGLRGELSRWMIEPKSNVFVGKMSTLVRDKLWIRVQGKLKGGGAILAYPAPTEQGFVIKSCGDPKCVPEHADSNAPHTPRNFSFARFAPSLVVRCDRTLHAGVFVLRTLSLYREGDAQPAADAKRGDAALPIVVFEQV